MNKLFAILFSLLFSSVAFAHAFVDQLNSMCHFPLVNENVATQIEINPCESATWWEDGLLGGVNVTMFHVRHKKDYLPPQIRLGPGPNAVRSVATNSIDSGTTCEIVDRQGNLHVASGWAAEVIARTNPDVPWLADVTYALRCQVK